MTREEKIARSKAEAEACWAVAGNEANPPEIRYGAAWGAMDWETNTALLEEESEE